MYHFIKLVMNPIFLSFPWRSTHYSFKNINFTSAVHLFFFRVTAGVWHCNRYVWIWIFILSSTEYDGRLLSHTFLVVIIVGLWFITRKITIIRVGSKFIRSSRQVWGEVKISNVINWYIVEENWIDMNMMIQVLEKYFEKTDGVSSAECEQVNSVFSLQIGFKSSGAFESGSAELHERGLKFVGLPGKY